MNDACVCVCLCVEMKSSISQDEIRLFDSRKGNPIFLKTCILRTFFSFIRMNILAVNVKLCARCRFLESKKVRRALK